MVKGNLETFGAESVLFEVADKAEAIFGVGSVKHTSAWSERGIHGSRVEAEMEKRDVVISEQFRAVFTVGGNAGIEPLAQFGK